MAETKRESAFVPEGWRFGKERPKGKGYEVPAEVLTTVDGCGLCGGPVKRFGRGREQRYRDAPMLGRPTVLVFSRQRYRCLDKNCRNDEGKRPVFTQPLVGVDESHRATTRLIEYVAEKCTDIGRTVRSLHEETGLAEKIISQILDRRAEELRRAPRARAPYCIGIDEAHLPIGTPCIIVDNINSRVLDLLELRNKTAVKRFLRSLPGVEHLRAVTMDMHRPYRDAVREECPWVAVVIDKFHVIDMAHKAVNTVRVERRKEMTRSQRREVLRDRELLWKNRKELPAQEREDLRAWLAAMPDLRAAYFLVKRFRLLWRAPSVEEALRRYERWRAHVPAGLLYAFKPLLTEMSNWAREVFNVIEYPYTNAFAERMNRDVKRIYAESQGCSLKVIRAKMVSRVNKRKPPATRKGASLRPRTARALSNPTGQQPAAVRVTVFQPTLPYVQSGPSAVPDYRRICGCGRGCRFDRCCPPG